MTCSVGDVGGGAQRNQNGVVGYTARQPWAAVRLLVKSARSGRTFVSSALYLCRRTGQLLLLVGRLTKVRIHKRKVTHLIDESGLEQSV